MWFKWFFVAFLWIYNFHSSSMKLCWFFSLSFFCSVMEISTKWCIICLEFYSVQKTGISNPLNLIIYSIKFTFKNLPLHIFCIFFFCRHWNILKYLGIWLSKFIFYASSFYIQGQIFQLSFYLSICSSTKLIKWVYTKIL